MFKSEDLFVPQFLDFGLCVLYKKKKKKALTFLFLQYGS